MRRAMRVARAVAMAALLVSCGTRVSDPSAGLSAADSVALIDRTPRCMLTPEIVAEAFALNAHATDLQRAMLEVELVDHDVEWNLLVYEVEQNAGRFEITTQRIPIKNRDATPHLRVVAIVLPQNEADDARLGALEAGDVIRVRGVVQEIRSWTTVGIAPAVVAGAGS